MLKFSSILAASIILLVCCLFFAPNWFHSEQIFKFNTGYIVFGIPLTIAILTLCLHIWRRDTSQKLHTKVGRELHDYYGGNTKVRSAPADVLNSLHIYNDISLRNYWSYRALGVISLASSLFLAVALGTTISVEVSKILAFVSSMSTGIIFSFNLVEKSNRARRAFRILLNAVMLYQHNEIDMRELLDRYSQAEDHLGEDEFKSGSATTTPSIK